MLKPAVQTRSGRRFPVLVTTVIVFMSAAFATVLVWQTPGLDRYAHDWLMRVRGPIPVSNEIALVVIDEASVAKLGRFPWPSARRTLSLYVVPDPLFVVAGMLRHSTLGW